MTAQPIPKAIYDKAKKEGVEKIILQFSGGSDEGHLNIELIVEDSHEYLYDKKARDFEKEIEDWAWKAYEYNGAGDGTDYGDDITYNLETNEVSTEEWYHVVEKSGNKWSNLEIAEEEEE